MGYIVGREFVPSARHFSPAWHFLYPDRRSTKIAATAASSPNAVVGERRGREFKEELQAGAGTFVDEDGVSPEAVHHAYRAPSGWVRHTGGLIMAVVGELRRASAPMERKPA